MKYMDSEVAGHKAVVSVLNYFSRPWNFREVENSLAREDCRSYIVKSAFPGDWIYIRLRKYNGDWLAVSAETRLLSHLVVENFENGREGQVESVYEKKFLRFQYDSTYIFIGFEDMGDVLRDEFFTEKMWGIAGFSED